MLVVGLGDGERSGEHANAAATADAPASAGKLNAVGGERGKELSAPRHFELN
jgi:hypothetical protein